MSAQAICLISLSYYKMVFQKNNISCNKATFDNAVPFYITTHYLQRGTNKDLTEQKDLIYSNRVQQAKITCFRHFFDMNMEANIRKTILKLINKIFSKTNKFHKIF